MRYDDISSILFKDDVISVLQMSSQRGQKAELKHLCFPLTISISDFIYSLFD